MPSPFPGMDPFIEMQKWTGFHTLLISELCETLVKLLRPRYEIDPEENIYVEETFGDSGYRADVAVSTGVEQPTSGPAERSQVGLLPTTYTLPMVQEQREPYLAIRTAGGRELVTIVELLSPTNKAKGGAGRRAYLNKRADVLKSHVHLVEIDLLLGGLRLPATPSLKATTDYCAFVCRAENRPKADVFEWTLRHALPANIPVPLAAGDADVNLDLQSSFTQVYDRAGYDYSVNYHGSMDLPLHDGDAEWIAQLVSQRDKRH